MPAAELEAWKRTILQNLEQAGPCGAWVAHYMREHDVRIRFAKLGNRGADVSPWSGEVLLDAGRFSPQTSPDSVSLLELIAHEVKHLAQGRLLAWSIAGETEAWRFQHAVYKELCHGASKGPNWEALDALPADLDHKALLAAKALMRAETMDRSTGRSRYPPAQWWFPLRPALGLLGRGRQKG